MRAFVVWNFVYTSSMRIMEKTIATWYMSLILSFVCFFPFRVPGAVLKTYLDNQQSVREHQDFFRVYGHIYLAFVGIDIVIKHNEIGVIEAGKLRGS